MSKKPFSELIKGDIPVLVDFHAEWCGPCKMMSPAIQDVAKTLGDKAKVIKIDIDKNPALAQKFQIRGVPTVMVFKQGEMKFRHSGVMGAADLINVVGQEIN